MFSTFKTIIRIFKMAGKDRGPMITSVFLSLIEKMLTFTPFMLIFYGVDSYLSGSLNEVVIRNVTILMIGSVVLIAIIRRSIDELLPLRGIRMFMRKRLEFLSHLSKLPMGYFNEGNLGNITSILTSEMPFAEEVIIMHIGETISSALSILLSIIFFSIFNIYLGLTYTGIIILGFLILWYLDRVNVGNTKDRQKQLGILSGKVVEYVRGMATIKAFNVTNQKGSDIENVFVKTKDKALKYEKEVVLPMFLVECSYTIGAIILLFVTLLLHSYNILDARYTIGLLIFGTASFLPLAVLASGNIRMRIFKASLDKYDRVMQEKKLIDGKKKSKIKNHDIEFNHVSFGYTSQDIINNVSFKLKEKTLTALVGKSGCGKTTITSLIARFWDVQKGSITIGGTDIRDVPVETLMDNISVVFQNVYLFQDTIFNNIAFGEENPTKKSVFDAAKRARCHDFIMKLPDGYDTMVGEGGSTLSGGEKQRIAIARAILKDAPIVLLDEATSSVDPENEKYIQDAITELVKNKTLIVIAHKLTSIVNADKILFIENGELVEEGTHKELIGKQGKYSKLYSSYV